MISTKNQKEAAITFVIVMVALALHQKIIVSRAFKNKKMKSKFPIPLMASL